MKYNTNKRIPNNNNNDIPIEKKHGLNTGCQIGKNKPVTYTLNISGIETLIQEIPDSRKEPKHLGKFIGKLDVGAYNNGKRNGKFKGCKTIIEGNKVIVYIPFESKKFGNPLL